ncbi:MAG: zf-HC2 domain-containing protein [Gemmatimonadota bacterium]
MKFLNRWFRGAQPPMIKCDDVMRQLWDYLDGELTPERAEAVRAHIDVCARCTPQTEFERAFLLAVKKTQREHSHLERLREDLMHSLQAQGFAPQ